MTMIAVPTLRPLMLQRTVAPAKPVATTPHTDVAGLNPADFAVLRQVLETVGHCAPAPPDPRGKRCVRISTPRAGAIIMKPLSACHSAAR